MKRAYQEMVDRAYQLFSACPAPEQRHGDGGWSVKEIVGHLVDSAGNNHQRLARYQPGGHLDFPGYDQETCVARAGYHHLDYGVLLSLWLNYNRLLLHMIGRIPETDHNSTITVGDGPKMTLDGLIESYFEHMALHVAQAAEITHRQGPCIPEGSG